MATAYLRSHDSVAPVSAALDALVPRHPVVGFSEKGSALQLLAVVVALAGLDGLHLVNLCGLVHLLRAKQSKPALMC